MKRFLATLLLFGILLSNQYAWSSWITKKSDTSEKVESIEKEYADGFISKSECNKQKSKVLKLKKISETICDNVKVKVAQSSWIKKKSKEEIKKEKSNYIQKKEKETKKEFVKKKKNLSKSIKKWISKKKTKDKRHFNSVAQLPKSDYYFTAVDGSGNTFIGYLNGNENEDSISVSGQSMLKISDGKAFQNNKKTQCDVRSEILKADKLIFNGVVIIKCPTKEFIGSWTQTGSEGFGIATSEKTRLEFNFSQSKKIMIAKHTENKTKTKIVKKDIQSEKIKDSICPEIKLVDNNQVFNSSDCKTKVAKIQVTDGNFSLIGFATDNEEVQRFSVDGRPIKLKSDGSFKYNGKTNSSKDVYLVATDKFGKITELKVSIEVLSQKEKFINKQKYYALLIGNSKYQKWDNLTSPVNDIDKIANTLEKKYKFQKVEVLKDASKDEIINAFYDMQEIVGKDGNLLIYYSGHGMTITRQGKEKHFWIPVDGTKEYKGGGRSWLSTSFVKDQADTLLASKVLIMVDSCFSGTFVSKGSHNLITEEEKSINKLNFLKMNVNRIGREYISSGANQQVEDTNGGKYSAFAKVFIQSLEDNNGHLYSKILHAKIHEYLNPLTGQQAQYSFIKNANHSKGVFVFSTR